jgi:hypothetical protein
MVVEDHLLHGDGGGRLIFGGDTVRPAISPWVGISLVRFLGHCCVCHFRRRGLVFCPLDFQNNPFWGTLNITAV